MSLFHPEKFPTDDQTEDEKTKVLKIRSAVTGFIRNSILENNQIEDLIEMGDAVKHFELYHVWDWVDIHDKVYFYKFKGERRNSKHILNDDEFL